MAIHNEFGNFGEAEATFYLVEKGYAILHRNWRSGKKELDIVAKKGEEVVIVEVKARKDIKFALPQDAVNEKKIRRIVAATDIYLKRHRIDNPVRFDIITVVGTNAPYEIEHIEGAFLPPVW